jgi:hypothetical protein
LLPKPRRHSLHPLLALACVAAMGCTAAVEPQTVRPGGPIIDEGDEPLPQPGPAVRRPRWIQVDPTLVAEESLDGDPLLGLPPPARRASIDERMRDRCRRHGPEIAQHSRRAGVDPHLLNALAWIESGWNPGVTSSRGAEGVMQMLPTTADKFGCGDPGNVACAAAAAAAYFRKLLWIFSDDTVYALAAYNAGPSQPRQAYREGVLPANHAFAAKVLDARARLAANGCDTR